ncbi:MAG: aldo/keto reductase, partial [Leptospiraceae bacterium]|nr:aldo/keto reductase [Leptospiraceae bacterium]
AQGLLTGKRINTEDLPEDDWRRRRSLFADEIQDKIQDASRKLKEIRVRYEITDAGLALAFLLHAEGVGGVICGMRNPDQLRENIRAASIALERTDQAEIANIWMETGVRDNQH